MIEEMTDEEFTEYVKWTTSYEYYERAEDITQDCSDIIDEYIDSYIPKEKP